MADLSKAKEWWLPDFYAGTTIHQLWGNAMNGNGTFFTDVNRQNFWAGLGFNATWNFAEGIFTKNAMALKSQAIVYESAIKKNQKLLEIIETYYDFLAIQLSYSVYDQLLDQSYNISKQLKIQVEAGLALESDWLLAQSKTYKIQSDELKARTAYHQKSSELLTLLGQGQWRDLVCTEKLLAPLEFIVLTPYPVLVDSLSSHHPEVKHAELLVDVIEEEKKMVTKGLLIPELRLGANGAYFGDVFSPIDPTYEINAAVLWKIPLGQLIYHGSENQYNAKIAIQNNEAMQRKVDISQQIKLLRSEISLYKRQYKLAKEGSKLAKKALSQAIARQKLGTARPLEVLESQELYMNAELDFLTSIAKCNTAQYKYFVAVGGSL